MDDSQIESRWSSPEKLLLCQLYVANPAITQEQMLPAFPSRSLDGVGAHLRRLRRGEHPATWETEMRATGLWDREASAEDEPAVPPEAFEQQLLALTRQGKGRLTLEGACDHFDCGPSRVREALEALKAQHYSVDLSARGVLGFQAPQGAGLVPIPLDHFRDGSWYRFGLISDTHLCSKYERMDVLSAAYDFYAAEGIREVLHAGNIIEGEARFNRNELLVPPGFEHQVDYLVEHYPKREGIVTRFITGDDHEGWYLQTTGLNIGKRIEQTAVESGRNDLLHLGYGECDLPFYGGGETTTGRPAVCRLVHPGGGSSYAISYAPQKLLESYSGGEKPQMAFIGHWHKSEMLWYRNAVIVQAGCTQDQTLFMRKKRLAAHVGFWVIEFQVSRDGAVSRFRGEWCPFFDAGFYANKYGYGTKEQVA